MKKKKNNAIRMALIVLLIGIIGFSGYKIGEKLLGDKKEIDHLKELAQIVAQAGSENDSSAADPGNPATANPGDPTTAPGDDVSSPEEPKILPQYAELFRRNADMFGWIKIEGTPIDYPVMYTPRDSQYYLQRDFDGGSLSSGMLFIDGACPADGDFYLIYGHHMKNGTMFGTLPKYAKEKYLQEHPTIRFDTLYEERTYQVAAAFYSQIYDSSVTGVFKYNEYRDLTDPNVFARYVEGVNSLTLYKQPLKAEYGDELITLSTCNSHTKDGRFVVVAKRIA